MAAPGDAPAENGSQGRRAAHGLQESLRPAPHIRGKIPTVKAEDQAHGEGVDIGGDAGLSGIAEHLGRRVQDGPEEPLGLRAARGVGGADKIEVGQLRSVGGEEDVRRARCQGPCAPAGRGDRWPALGVGMRPEGVS